MKRQQYKRWQVVVAVIVFLAIYGLVGTLERQGEVTVPLEIRFAEVVK